jgi:hypothetical protein
LPLACAVSRGSPAKDFRICTTELSVTGQNDEKCAISLFFLSIANSFVLFVRACVLHSLERTDITTANFLTLRFQFRLEENQKLHVNTFQKRKNNLGFYCYKYADV